jgi:hypothetical protein
VEAVTGPVSLDAKRTEKKGRCAICGKPAHEFVGQCHRVASITEEIDGSVTYTLYPLDEPPEAA